MKTYQKECKLKDGSVVLLRPLVAEDREGLITFFPVTPGGTAPLPTSRCH